MTTDSRITHLRTQNIQLREEIERLAAALHGAERLLVKYETTLREIAEQTDEMGRPTYVADIARAALEGKP